MKNEGDCLQDRDMKKKHINYFYIASLNAYKSNMDKNYGAVLVYKNKIIGVGHNHSIDYITHSYNFIEKNKKILQNIHAENDAILDAIKNGYKNIISKSDIYISRVLNINELNKNDDIKFIKAIPCDNCKKMIMKYKIKKTYYISSIHG